MKQKKELETKSLDLLINVFSFREALPSFHLELRPELVKLKHEDPRFDQSLSVLDIFRQKKFICLQL